jgi:hypothetical protein
LGVSGQKIVEALMAGETECETYLGERIDQAARSCSQ